MGRKRPKACAISNAAKLLKCPEEIWNTDEDQHKIRPDDIEFINDLCCDSFEGFDNFCKVNDFIVLNSMSCIIFYVML